MLEPVFNAHNKAVWHDLGDSEKDRETARTRALLHRATNIAIEGAFTWGIDLPVGAVAARGDWIVGRYHASDQRLRHRAMHAEFMAIQDWRMSNITSGAEAPSTVVVTLEPCDNCQDFLATIPSVKRVGFGLPRAAMEDRSLVKHHDETIYERAARLKLPYEVFQIDEPPLQRIGETILDFCRRDPQAEVVEIDLPGLHDALVALNGA